MSSSRADAYDDYDDGYSRRRSSGGGGGNTAVKVIAIIGVVVLLIAGACGGIGYMMFMSTKKAMVQMQQTVSKEMEKIQENQKQEQVAREAAESFVRELKENNIDGAYDLTSSGYKKRVKVEALKALAKKHAGLIEQFVSFTPDANANYAVPKTSIHYTARVFHQVEERFYELAVTVLLEEEEWLVESFTIAKENPAAKASK
jgi:hypothetical protein